jgi:DNA-binding MarR family transcriptional regulator
MAVDSAEPALAADVRKALRAYIDAITLAEPIQAALWKSAGVTVTQLAVLHQLRSGPMAAGQLGRRVGLSPASITHLLDRLEERGLVSRRRSAADRRCVEVHATEAGQRFTGETRVFRGSRIHCAVEAMAPEGRARLAAALEDLVRHVHAIADAGDGRPQ